MINSILTEVGNKSMKKNIIPTYCCTDNKSPIRTFNYTKILTEKRLKVDVYIITEMMEEHEVEDVVWCERSSQSADSCIL